MSNNSSLFKVKSNIDNTKGRISILSRNREQLAETTQVYELNIPVRPSNTARIQNDGKDLLLPNSSRVNSQEKNDFMNIQTSYEFSSHDIVVKSKGNSNTASSSRKSISSLPQPDVSKQSKRQLQQSNQKSDLESKSDISLELKDKFELELQNFRDNLDLKRQVFDRRLPMADNSQDTDSSSDNISRSENISSVKYNQLVRPRSSFTWKENSSKFLNNLVKTINEYRDPIELQRIHSKHDEKDSVRQNEFYLTSTNHVSYESKNNDSTKDGSYSEKRVEEFLSFPTDENFRDYHSIFNRDPFDAWLDKKNNIDVHEFNPNKYKEDLGSMYIDDIDSPSINAFDAISFELDNAQTQSVSDDIINAVNDWGNVHDFVQRDMSLQKRIKRTESKHQEDIDINLRDSSDDESDDMFTTNHTGLNGVSDRLYHASTSSSRSKFMVSPIHAVEKTFRNTGHNPNSNDSTKLNVANLNESLYFGDAAKIKFFGKYRELIEISKKKQNSMPNLDTSSTFLTTLMSSVANSPAPSAVKSSAFNNKNDFFSKSQINSIFDHTIEPVSPRTKFLKNYITLTKSMKAPIPIIIRSERNREELNLSHMLLKDDYILLLSQIIHELPHLNKLNVRDNQLTDHSMAILMKSIQSISTITDIDISENKLDKKTLLSLFNFLSHDSCKLKILRLSETCLDDFGVSLFISGLEKNKTLVKLDLGHNVIGANSLFSVDNKHKVPYKSISNEKRNNKKPVSAKSTLLSIPANREQNSNNPLIGLAAISSALNNNKTIRQLNLSWNKIGPISCMELAKPLSTSSLIKLNIAYNSIKDQGAEAIAEALFSNYSLEYLDLSYNSISANGTYVLANSLKINPYLKVLDLSGNSIGLIGGFAIISTLNFHDVNRDIYLHQCTYPKLSNNIAILTMNDDNNDKKLKKSKKGSKKGYKNKGSKRSKSRVSDSNDPASSYFDRLQFPSNDYNLDLSNIKDWIIMNELLFMASVRRGCKFVSITYRKSRDQLKPTSIKLIRPKNPTEDMGLCYNIWQHSYKRPRHPYTNLAASKWMKIVSKLILVNVETGREFIIPREGLMNIKYKYFPRCATPIECLNATGLKRLINLIITHRKNINDILKICSNLVLETYQLDEILALFYQLSHSAPVIETSEIEVQNMVNDISIGKSEIISGNSNKDSNNIEESNSEFLDVQQVFENFDRESQNVLAGNSEENQGSIESSSVIADAPNLNTLPDKLTTNSKTLTLTIPFKNDNEVSKILGQNIPKGVQIEKHQFIDIFIRLIACCRDISNCDALMRKYFQTSSEIKSIELNLRSLFYFCCNSITGHYKLDLSLPLDRICLLRILEINADERSFIKYYRRHDWNKVLIKGVKSADAGGGEGGSTKEANVIRKNHGYTSQRGNRNNFRNEIYRNKRFLRKLNEL